MKIPKLLIYFIGFSVLLILLGVIPYLIYFNDGFSYNAATWGAFGDYFNLFINIVSLLFIIGISIITYDASERFNRLQLRPHIYVYEAERVNVDLINPRTWQMYNSSNVPAINVLVRYNWQGKWSKWLICFSLGKEMNRELGWIYYANEIEIVYSDMENRVWYKYNFKDFAGSETTIDKDVFNGLLHSARLSRFSNGVMVTTNNLTELMVTIKNNNLFQQKGNLNIVNTMIWQNLQKILF